MKIRRWRRQKFGKMRDESKKAEAINEYGKKRMMKEVIKESKMIK